MYVLPQSQINHESGSRVWMRWLGNGNKAPESIFCGSSVSRSAFSAPPDVWEGEVGKDSRRLRVFSHFLKTPHLNFLGTIDQPYTLQNFMKNLNVNIQYTFTYSNDLLIYLTYHRQLSPTLYRKPTDCAPLLHFLSNHSLRCKERIIFSQVLRCNLIISEDHNLQRELRHLTLSLLTRGYLLEIINENIEKAMNSFYTQTHIINITPHHFPFYHPIFC